MRRTMPLMNFPAPSQSRRYTGKFLGFQTEGKYSMEELNIGIIGTKFMGSAHSNAYRQASHFFDLPLTPVMHTACGRDEQQFTKFANRQGWKHQENSWEKLILNDDIALIDICVPNGLHKPIAMAALKAGKHVLCEKPMALNAEEAWLMLEAAGKSPAINMMVFNYRFVPAIILAKQIISDGKIGEVRHFNAVYYQDWLVDKNFPIVWRHDVYVSGSGAHGDMNAHIIDLARYLFSEFREVTGVKKTFIKERPFSDGNGVGKVTADDATCFLAKFQNGALGSFIATRMAPGKKNFMCLEIFGSEGSLIFNLERLNELQFYSTKDEAGERGYKNILVTESVHPYMNAWWPAGHVIGWEHTFIHLVKELFQAIAGEQNEIPTFYDGYKCQEVLDAVMTSASTGSWVSIDNLKKQEI